MIFNNFKEMVIDDVHFSLGTDRQGKTTIHAHYGENARDVALVTPACVTNWPRVNGDGNFGTMWGPTDIQKAKYTLDLTDSCINSESNCNFETLSSQLERLDDRLLDFVQANQMKILGRKNLTREEVKMLQIRSVRSKYDKNSGALTGHSLQLSASKYRWDGMGGKINRVINICDMDGTVLPDAVVQPGDIVAASIFVNQIYTGVGGDKFGIHWSFEDVQVICQRTQMAQKTQISCFTDVYSFAMPFTGGMAEAFDATQQFSEPMACQ